jgi:hypothetical protein
VRGEEGANVVLEAVGRHDVPPRVLEPHLHWATDGRYGVMTWSRLFYTGILYDTMLLDLSGPLLLESFTEKRQTLSRERSR